MDPKRIEPAKQISQRRPLLCPYFIPYPLNSRACITFHHLKDETVRLLDLKYKVTEICKEKHLMEELEPTEAGKPLAEFIKEMSDPNRKTRYLGWKTKADVPPFLQAKEKSLVTAPELHFLLRCGPTVRGAFTEVFRQDGYLRSKFHSQLYLARDGKFLLPALALHSINPTFVESYLGYILGIGQKKDKERTHPPNQSQNRRIRSSESVIEPNSPNLAAPNTGTGEKYTEQDIEKMVKKLKHLKQELNGRDALLHTHQGLLRSHLVEISKLRETLRTKWQLVCPFNVGRGFLFRAASPCCWCYTINKCKLASAPSPPDVSTYVNIPPAFTDIEFLLGNSAFSGEHNAGTLGGDEIISSYIDALGPTRHASTETEGDLSRTS